MPSSPFRSPRPTLAWLMTALLALTAPVAAAEQTATAQEAQPETRADADVQAEQPTRVGWLKLSGPLRDAPAPYDWVSEADLDPSLTDVLGQLEHVAAGDHYAGLVIYFDQPELSLSQIETLARGIRNVREAGRTVLAFAEAYDLRTYLLASEADRVLLQHKGLIHLSGLSVEELYLAGLLEKVGAQADLVQIGQFKGANEQYTRTGPSEAWNQNISGLLDNLYDQIVSRIGENRDLARDEVESLMADCWVLSDQELAERGLVDHLVSRDLKSATEEVYAETFFWDDKMGYQPRSASMPSNPFALVSMLMEGSGEKPLTRSTSIAVIHACGHIHSGESSRGEGLITSQSIGSRTMLENLAQVRDDDNVRGVIIRLDSPGGSALASEVIWQAVREVAETKPVFASVSNMAASGGYYIVCASDQVYVSPRSIVGSIGVVGGKIVLGGLYDKLGVDVHRRSRGPAADMFNSVEPFNQQQRTRIRQAMQRIYEQFTDRVQRGRGDRVSDISAVARGRLFTGQQAVANGLADELGSLDDALARLAGDLELSEGEYDVVHLPQPMSLGEFLSSMFEASSPTIDADLRLLDRLGRTALGDAGWQQTRQVLSGLMLLQHEPALTVMPQPLIVR
ncbi:MAG: signal peptide peptidase SppA [Phycisphaeraceae bacterium]